jgi:hypothetical protein
MSAAQDKQEGWAVHIKTDQATLLTGADQPLASGTEPPDMLQSMSRIADTLDAIHTSLERIATSLESNKSMEDLCTRLRSVDQAIRILGIGQGPAPRKLSA